MYERFTDRARRVMQLANQEAQRFQHEYIGTEHVLLGLVKEGSGVAANVLKNLDVDLRRVRLEVEKLVTPGPTMVTMGRLPQTPRTNRMLEDAIKKASALGHNYVGTEHILLGLTRVEDCIAHNVLFACGVTLEAVRKGVLALLGEGLGAGDGPRDEPVTRKRVDFVELRVPKESEIQRYHHSLPLTRPECGGMVEDAVYLGTSIVIQFGCVNKAMLAERIVDESRGCGVRVDRPKCTCTTPAGSPHEPECQSFQPEHLLAYKLREWAGKRREFAKVMRDRKMWSDSKEPSADLLEAAADELDRMNSKIEELTRGETNTDDSGEASGCSCRR